ncbi:PhnD/SsuA/transferrin family substrate-binding protein [Halomonas sp. BC04]|uniref:PhnD/SsuA/transferrin family substrate-binding protein n=1 Tax=Halomonas sp. BC04 TaxID=1403540 RepID=UPI0003ED7E14|nr:PhnD/SsuA/transferrin family substrate-binding protein [Halomonas sp. BC04]EWG98945.1 hypothetical protein Q427_27805 [Halomonas sp. BC04]
MLKRWHWPRSLRLALALMVGTVPLSAGAGEVITLGIFAYRDTVAVEARFAPLKDVFSEALEGREVRLEVLSLDALDSAISEGRLDFILTNPRHFLAVRDTQEVSGALATLVKQQGEYRLGSLAGVILARQETGAEGLAGLEGRTIGVPGRRFLGGFMAQAYEIYQQGYDPERFADYLELGSHDAVVRALLDGEVQAGFVRSGILEDWQNDGHDISALKVMAARPAYTFPLTHSTSLYPEWPLAALSHVPVEEVRRVGSALLRWEGTPVAQGGGVRFAPSQDYLPVERAARALGVPPFAEAPRSIFQQLWQEYGVLLWIALALGAGLTVAMGLLLIFYRRQKHDTNRLEEERHALQNILWGTAAGTWLWNVQTGETRFNERWAEMVGYRLEEISPTTIETWLSFCHDEDLEQSDAALKEHFAGRCDSYDIEVRMRHRDGHWVWVHDRGRVVSRDEVGEPLWMAGTHSDITQRKQAELRAAQLMEQMRKHAGLIPGALYQYRQHPDGRCSFPYASDGIQDIYGVTPEEVRDDARPVFAVIEPEDMPRVAESIAQSERELTTWRATYRVHHPRKGQLWVDGISTPERLDDGGTMWHGYLRDVTDDYATQRQLEGYRDSLERSNKELEHFAYAASHDLRQPLRMVTSYAQLLERHLADRLDEDGKTMLHYMRDGAQRMDSMLLSLLDYSRVGRKGEPKRQMGLRDALDEATHFLKPAITESEATIALTGEWPEVVASPDEMTRLLQNLLGNALKYRAPDKAPLITVAVEPVAAKSYWQITICDNGIGIDPEQIGRLFKVFQRLHTREQYEGTGVGLAVCRKIVERHGGEIWAESEGQGQGSCFIFTLPKAGKEAAGA